MNNGWPTTLAPTAPLTTHHLPLTTHHLPLTTHHSPLTTPLFRLRHAKTNRRYRFGAARCTQRVGKLPEHDRCGFQRFAFSTHTASAAACGQALDGRLPVIPPDDP